MRRILLLPLLVACGVGGWWFWNDLSTVRDTIESYVENGELITLKAKYTADHLMNTHRQELLGDAQHSFQEPVLKLYPYLLIDAKYTQADKRTREGSVIWGLTDGEMVIDTDTWETTHGFEDAINANANRNDFKILLVLAKHKGSLSRNLLAEELHLEADILNPWIESVLAKQLVVQHGNVLQLHFQNPKILVEPQTKITQTFVSKSTYQTQRTPRKYSRAQIEKIAQAAFGPSFTIRKVTEFYLPVHNISVLNPDGTIFTSNWNAINGRRITANTTAH